MIKELTQYLATETELTIGTELFAGFAAASIDDAVIIIESGGAGNFYLPDRADKTIQVICRSKDYHTARDWAMLIYNVLHGLAGVTLPVVDEGEELYFINTAEALSPPQSLGQDDKGRFNISTNYVLRKQDANE